MRNPTSCAPATTTMEATGRKRRRAGGRGPARFTPTGCGALPFAPHIEASIGGYGRTGRTAQPAIRTVVRQGGW